MNIFNLHPKQQGITYMAHLKFAFKIAIRLSNSVFAFTSHAIFPFIPVRRSLDLEATMDYLQQQNEWIESQKIQSKTPVTTRGDEAFSLGK